jgi:hypothetical protein
MELKAAQEQARYESMSEKQLAREIKRLEKEMLDYARNLEFEKAAEARDRLAELRRSVFGASPSDEAPGPLAAGSENEGPGAQPGAVVKTQPQGQGGKGTRREHRPRGRLVAGND